MIPHFWEKVNLAICTNFQAKIVEIAKDTIKIAKQAVLIGIAICIILMLVACTGILPAFVGAMFQEVIDTVSILWALKARKVKLD